MSRSGATRSEMRWTTCCSPSGTKWERRRQFPSKSRSLNKGCCAHAATRGCVSQVPKLAVVDAIHQVGRDLWHDAPFTRVLKDDCGMHLFHRQEMEGGCPAICFASGRAFFCDIFEVWRPLAFAIIPARSCVPRSPLALPSRVHRAHGRPPQIWW